jgi:hypothetical protein
MEGRLSSVQRSCSSGCRRIEVEGLGRGGVGRVLDVCESALLRAPGDLEDVVGQPVVALGQSCTARANRWKPGNPASHCTTGSIAPVSNRRRVSSPVTTSNDAA